MIETERLYLIPLTASQLKLWIEDISSLEKELNCCYRAEHLEGMFLDIVKGQLEKTEKDKINYLFHSFWFLIRKTDRVVVGSADFKGVPNENNEVEIGYGLGKAYEHNRKNNMVALISNAISNINCIFVTEFYLRKNQNFSTFS